MATIFEIGGYKYSKLFGNRPIVPEKLKEDYAKGRHSTRTDLVLAVIKELKDGRIVTVGDFCKKDFCAESFPYKINGFLEVNNVPYAVEVTKTGERRGKGGKVSHRPLELVIKKIKKQVGRRSGAGSYVYGILWKEKESSDIDVKFFKVEGPIVEDFEVDTHSETKALKGKWDQKDHWPVKNGFKLYKTHNSARNFGLNCFRAKRAAEKDKEFKGKILSIVELFNQSRINDVPEISKAQFLKWSEGNSLNTFYERIIKLREKNKIPKEWAAKDIRPFLEKDFKESTIGSYPFNCSISLDGKTKGNYVKFGEEPKFYRVGTGMFTLINDPNVKHGKMESEDQEDEEKDIKYQRDIEDAIPVEPKDGPQPPAVKRDVKRGRGFQGDPALAKAVVLKHKYLCNFDKSHKTFTSKVTGQNYVEAHHLIPLSLQEEFQNSLDHQANIIPLCPNCHRKFHHADEEEQKQMIETFYKKRKKDLEKAGIFIELDKLFEKY